jgi:sirohydrochlorin cobaltochelatase
MTGKIGVMVCGHGSRSQPAVDEFAVVVRRLRDVVPDWPVEYGYLEFANPVLRDGLDRLREQGCDRILAVPGMLFAAMHAKNDIPSVLNTYAANHGIRIDYGRDLGVDPKMLAAAADRVREAIARADAEAGPVSAHDTCLVVIGRGASDPDANANVSKVTRLLWEGFGFGWAETGYSGVTFPLVEPCLERVVRLGFRRVVVFPYFLFTGVLVDRIYGFTDWVAERNPGTDFVKAGYLNDHPQVVATFAERAREILDGQNAMNCQMCKYRAQVLGFEAEVGSPQESHHHHVEGQGASAPGANVADCPLCDTFCTGACRLSDAAPGPHHHGHDHAHDHHHHDHAHEDGHGHAHGHEHHHHHGHAHDHHPHERGHGHAHGHAHGHDHHHPPYPHADHPLGPESVRRHLKARG